MKHPTGGPENWYPTSLVDTMIQTIILNLFKEAIAWGIRLPRKVDIHDWISTRARCTDPVMNLTFLGSLIFLVLAPYIYREFIGFISLYLHSDLFKFLCKKIKFMINSCLVPVYVQLTFVWFLPKIYCSSVGSSSCRARNYRRPSRQMPWLPSAFAVMPL